MLKEFKAFLIQYNVIGLAVAVVIGAAAGALVKSLVTNIITPLVTIPGKVNFSQLAFHVGGSVFRYGQVINALISLVIIAFVVFFFIVRPLGKLQNKFQSSASPTMTCPACLSSIPLKATKCAFCTIDLPTTTSSSQPQEA
ncbi:large conductance mechanosensitive channel protein MscL [Ferrimicrobium acidiphilum]|jgi:large conductance mechanosensitive channel|uniref:Large-conductance mechanosensitive channel n=1 Tax=Ferrimicrobium acidiphilum DSM 19497 TaxID=1121877 RepID=A0A0D8FQX9_9ACTN|nr:large conductance mechanosensitive channel protein MscL [Ferrimicrobium acidiphilum]KJE75680.1 large-conductance mechanosensitive channel [Ferrimicrobium acidiphilum DSM 19497]MCL5052207.1 large conductance mechanosensitive channel protein MscL [Gammaproteobacteria bacterium]